MRNLVLDEEEYNEYLEEKASISPNDPIEQKKIKINKDTSLNKKVNKKVTKIVIQDDTKNLTNKNKSKKEERWDLL